MRAAFILLLICAALVVGYLVIEPEPPRSFNDVIVSGGR